MRQIAEYPQKSGPFEAVLGPTNTGKTYDAIERMLSHRTGVIGFPLRLLARENYERVAAIKGKSQVALVTGEEKIIPPHARYFFCTVESMPLTKDFEFLAVDEIQLCADPDRGHIFTDRLLHARGTKETFFMGADTMRPIMKSLFPDVRITARERFSTLTYKGYKKLTRLPKRSAIVAFSMDDVYHIAELVKRQRGGTAVVLGALSPRTRNKQVEMYQSGDVDFMVATDAIGMGLNMDVGHVAFGGTRKYDGKMMRPLTRAELGQVAGRAGRYRRDGTFGVTGRVRGIEPDDVAAIQEHIYAPVEQIYWRNAALDFQSPHSLLRSLDQTPDRDVFMRGRPADDYIALSGLMQREDILARAGSSAAVRMLWDVCQIPDFRKTLSDAHKELLGGIYTDLMDLGKIHDETVKRRIRRLDNTEGDIDTLMARISHVRTWTYITHKAEWVRDADRWQEETRAIEDKLSDALHQALTRRFVDRRSSVLIKAMEGGIDLLAGVKRTGEVVVEGEPIGILNGFVFKPDGDARGTDYKAVMKAARQVLIPEMKRRVNRMINAKDTQFTLTQDGEILYQAQESNPTPGVAVAKLVKGDAVLKPSVEIIAGDLVDATDKDAAQKRLADWLAVHLIETLGALPKMDVMTDTESASARGIGFQLFEACGVLPRENVQGLIDELDESGRNALRSRKIRMAPVLIYFPQATKPACVRLKAMLWTIWHGGSLPADVPADGITSQVVDPKTIDADYYRAIGYPVYGPRAIRVDILDRIVGAIYDSASEGKFQAKHEMAEWLGSTIADLYEVIEALGHKKIHDPAEEAEAKAAAEAETKTAEAPQEQADATKAEADAEGDKASDEKAADAKVEETADISEDASKDAPQDKAADVPQEKPELATFALKRGKAHEKGRRPASKGKPKSGAKPNKKKGGKPNKKSGGPSKPRVISSGPHKSATSNPFDVLKDLQNSKKG